MGDDVRGEYIYKFVSKALWNQSAANRLAPTAAASIPRR
jgi:secreted PhoX family phosphatase